MFHEIAAKLYSGNFFVSFFLQDNEKKKKFFIAVRNVALNLTVVSIIFAERNEE